MSRSLLPGTLFGVALVALAAITEASNYQIPAQIRGNKAHRQDFVLHRTNAEMDQLVRRAKELYKRYAPSL